MKLDVSNLRYMSRDDFRVLTAVEMGQRNHDLVPTELIAAIAGLKHGGSHKVLGNLLRNKLVYHERRDYDGYRLTYAGYDFLALKTLLQRGAIAGVGRQIGVGKESDIFLVSNEDGDTLALKLQRLGRTSFRTIKKNRDYLGQRRSASWLYMSRLGALREFAFMTALHAAGFPTPTPVEANRHAVLMSLVPGTVMNNIRSGGLEDAAVASVFHTCMSLVARLAHVGLVHCDFNEFNIMVGPPKGASAEPNMSAFHEAAYGVTAPTDEPSASIAGDAPVVTMIDFPQMISVAHPNAAELWQRDVDCLQLFFAKRFGYTSGAVPTWEAVTGPPRPLPAAGSGSTPAPAAEAGATTGDAAALAADATASTSVAADDAAAASAAALFSPSESALARRLDVVVEASGFSEDTVAAFETLMASTRGAGAAALRSGAGAAGREDDEEGGTGKPAAEDDGVDSENDDDDDDVDGIAGPEEPHESRGAGADGDASAAGGGAFVTLADDVLAAGDDDEEGDEDEDDEEDDSDADDVSDDDRRVVASDEALAGERPPEGVRTRPGGGRIRPKKGKAAAALAAATSGGAGGRGGAGGAAAADDSDVRERVKRDFEKKARRAELAAAARGGTKGRNAAKDREKVRTNTMVKQGDWW